MKKILVIVGTRPNFIKVTQFKRLALEYDLDLRIVHTGQHFDDKMADVFFRQFKLKPDYILEIEQNISREEFISQAKTELLHLIKSDFAPDLVMVVGDVNSTLAGALAANDLNLPIAHIESGLRSRDLSMPEEINRIETDSLTHYFFVTEQSGLDNLISEGVMSKNIHLVGNTMIDTLVAFEKEIEESKILYDLELSKPYVLMTMHRPATVDQEEGLLKILDLLNRLKGKYKIIFPIHPRTTKNIKKFELERQFNAIENLIFSPPLDYFSFQKLIKHSTFILTDSGGIQEESTFLKIPCLTLRPNTERPITCTLGTNTLVPFEVELILKYVKQIEEGSYKKGSIPLFWDGKASERIFEIIMNL